MIKAISPSIKYIGVDDIDLDLFESQYVVPEGMSYNSYLILDERIAVLDTVDGRKGEDWLRNLEEALDGRRPDYLVVHHMEPDHSSLILTVLEKYPELRLVTSAKSVAMLGQFFEAAAFEGRVQVVKEGEELSLGKHTLRFLMAPMVHWPEVMVSFETTEKVLFSADAFGKFGALSKCGYFGEEDDDWACEARRYYFNICGKYGVPVQTLLKKVLPLSPEVIAPLHGPVLRENLASYLDLYRTWSSYGVETEGVFIAYASIHGGTSEVAEKLAEILRAKGCPKVAVSDLSRDDMGEAVEDAFRYGRMVVAAASYDGGLFTPAWLFLHTLQMKAYQQRRVALVENGSWAPSAGRVMKEMFGAMKDITLVEPLVTIRSRMKDTDLPSLEALADAILQ
jgi:flavorubredoxin